MGRAEDDRFASLECSFMSETGWVVFRPNERGFPINENASWFEGEGQLLIATPEAPEADEYQKRVFDGSRRLFELQISGQLKRAAPLFITGELETDRMRVSGLTRLVAKGALGLFGAFGVEGLEYSFGPPYIATPLWSAASGVVVGDFKVGSRSIGAEPAEHKARRRKGNFEPPLGKTTWIFEAGAFVDVREWAIKLPGLPKVDLHRLWLDAPLVVAVYATDENGDKQYLARLRMRHVKDGTKRDVDDIFWDAPSEGAQDPSDDESDSDESFATAVEDVARPVVVRRGGFPWKRPSKMDALLDEARPKRLDDAPARCLGRIQFDRASSYVVCFGKDVVVMKKPTSVASTAAAAAFAGDHGGATRVAPGERTRRKLDATVAALSCVKGVDAVRNWLPKGATNLADFLDDTKWKQRSGDVASDLCLRAASTRAWRLEWCALNQDLEFYDSRQRRTFIIDLADVIEVRAVSERPTGRRSSPFAALDTSLDVVCVERVVRLVFARTAKRDSWLALLGRGRREQQTPANDDEESSERLGSLARDRLATPGLDWRPSGRYILNARRLFDDDDNADEGDPLALAESLLRSVQALVDASGEDRLEAWPAFLDKAGKLRDVAPPDDSLAFWLNVYHAMIAHAALVFGSPSKASQWAKYFGSLSYECAGDVFSVAELEHCVIRAAMPRPRLLLGDVATLGASVDLLRVALATSSSLSSSYAYARDHKDIRLVFALNPGSLEDSPPVVVVYDADHLQDQLDAATRRALASASLDPVTRTVTLPRLCAWHSSALSDLQPFLPNDIRAALVANASASWRCAYHPFDFACRIPRLLPDEAAAADGESTTAPSNADTPRRQRPSSSSLRGFTSRLLAAAAPAILRTSSKEDVVAAPPPLTSPSTSSVADDS